jgi:hypothetical protein
MPTKPPSPSPTGPLDGAYYWLPVPIASTSIRWDLITCHDLGVWDGVSHREFWPSVLAHLAPTWGKTPEALRGLLGDHYYGLPRGRVSRPKGRYLLLHGKDSPVPDWEDRIIDRFCLAGRRVTVLHDEHETMIPGHRRLVEELLGIRISGPGS